MDAILGNKGRENPNTKFKTGMKSAAEMLTENKEKHIPRSGNDPVSCLSTTMQIHTKLADLWTALNGLLS